jgi:DNA-binding SARP family transcriptional activator
VSAVVLHYRRTWWAWVGESSRALSVVEEPVGAQHGRYVERGRLFSSLLRWHVGTLEHAERLVLGDALDRASTIGERHLVVEGAATVALFHLSAGDVSAATELMDLAQRSATGLEPGSWGLIALLQVRAVLAVMEGDESAAAELLRQTFPHEPPTRACAAHVHTNVIALGYALVPELAAIWDDVELGTDFAVGREVGRAITAVRSGVLQPAARLPWADLQRLRTWAFEPHLAELAVAAVAAGNRDAKAAIDALRSDPERHMMRLGRHPIDRVADEARTIAASISRRPGEMLEIGLLGPMTLRRDGVVVLDPALRRVRVRELLGVVAHHRRVSRRRIAELLWPDKDEPSAANNLRVTLNQLHRVLEPDRSARWRPWFVRTAGEDLVLEAGDTLIVDVDEFDRAIERGRTADRAGRASDALAAYLEGCEWYRGDYLGDAMAGEYAYLDQLRLRSDATSAATRASQLLLAQGRAIEARDLASRAVVLDPYLDAPHLVLAQAYRVDDRQDLARVVIERHLTMLRDNAMEPSAELLAELERP